MMADGCDLTLTGGAIMMRVVVITLTLTLAAASTASAVQTVYYSWEDGATVLGSADGLTEWENVSGPQNGLAANVTYSCPGPQEGDRYLRIAEAPHTDPVSRAYVAWVTGLRDGDFVEVGVSIYDITSGYPTGRVSGHYTTSADINDNQGAPGIASNYTSAIGWNFAQYLFMGFNSAGATRDAWCAEIELFCSPWSGDYHSDMFVDWIYVTAPDHAVIHFPEPSSSTVENGTWSSIKTLYR
jgi:hypothetical protein